MEASLKQGLCTTISRLKALVPARRAHLTKATQAIREGSILSSKEIAWAYEKRMCGQLYPTEQLNNL